MIDEPFVWTFPIYFLARGFVAEPGTSRVTIDLETTEFYGLAVDGENHVVVFTDRDAAETFRNEHLPEKGFIALGFDPSDLLSLLELMATPNHLFVVDPNPQVDRITLRPAQALIEETHRQLQNGA